MRFIANNPEIMSALIAAVVSLVIAASSGFYVLVRSNQRVDNLRNELLDTRRTERFLNAADGFRKKFREYETTANEIKAAATGDDTELIQHLLNFYGGIARHIYDEHKSFMGNEEAPPAQQRLTTSWRIMPGRNKPWRKTHSTRERRYAPMTDPDRRNLRSLSSGMSDPLHPNTQYRTQFVVGRFARTHVETLIGLLFDIFNRSLYTSPITPAAHTQLENTE